MRAHAGASSGIGRQQRRLRPEFVQVFEDRQRLADGVAVVHQRRHQLLRIDRAVGLGMLLAAVSQQVHRHDGVVASPFRFSAMRTR